MADSSYSIIICCSSRIIEANFNLATIKVHSVEVISHEILRCGIQCVIWKIQCVIQPLVIFFKLVNIDNLFSFNLNIDINHSLLYTAACLNGLTFTQSIPNEFNDKINNPSDGKYSTEQIGRLYPEIQVSTQRLETNCDLNSTWRVTITGN